MNNEIAILKDKYVNIVIDTISIALPVCINAVPAKTKTKSGYAIAAAKDEFLLNSNTDLLLGELLFSVLEA